MQVGAIIQARLDSARLPGKVLLPLRGRPVLSYLVDGLRHASGVSTIVIATSDRAIDDPIAEFARELGLRCHRGSADDVAGRMLAAARATGLDVFLRATGDSPLLDPQLVDEGIRLFEPGLDVVTNKFPVTYPPGQSVEIVATDALARAHDVMHEPDDHEHVTRYFYLHPDEFRIRSFRSARPYDGIHLAVDREQDLSYLEALLGRLDRPHWTYGVDRLVEIGEAA